MHQLQHKSSMEARNLHDMLRPSPCPRHPVTTVPGSALSRKQRLWACSGNRHVTLRWSAAETCCKDHKGAYRLGVFASDMPTATIELLGQGQLCSCESLSSEAPAALRQAAGETGAALLSGSGARQAAGASLPASSSCAMACGGPVVVSLKSGQQLLSKAPKQEG